MPHHLLGVAEIAAMLGLTRQRVNQLVQSADFPTPEAELSAGRIWSRQAIETWVAAHPDRATEAGTSMFGQFTDGARAVVIRAQEEARKLRHDYIGTEHLLLAVLSQAAPGLRQRLASIGIDREGVAADVASRCPPGEVAPVGHIPFTPRSKSVLTNAASAAGGAVEARHIAHAVVRMSDGLAAELMRNRTQLDQDELVAAVDRAVGGSEPAIFATAPPVDESLRCSFCGTGAAQVQKLIAGPGVYICDACIDLCNRIIADEPPPEPKSLATRVDELAAELDRLRRDIEASG